MMATDEMTCRELVELVTEYLEGTLAPMDRARFEEHLEGCPGCRIYVEQMRQTISLVGMLAEESMFPEARQELLAIFQDWKRR